jgi:hypothetical protein
MLCRMLCDAGADPTTVDSRGYDPVAYAQQGKSLRCSEYLLQMRNIVLGRSAAQTFGNNLEPGWERNIDITSGLAYYYDAKRGVSLWEDEYFEMLQKTEARKNLNGSFAAVEESSTETLVSPSRFGSNSNKTSQEAVESKTHAWNRESALSHDQEEMTPNPILSPINGSKPKGMKQVETDVLVSSKFNETGKFNQTSPQSIFQDLRKKKKKHRN